MSERSKKIVEMVLKHGNTNTNIGLGCLATNDDKAIQSLQTDYFNNDENIDINNCEMILLGDDFPEGFGINTPGNANIENITTKDHYLTFDSNLLQDEKSCESSSLQENASNNNNYHGNDTVHGETVLITNETCLILENLDVTNTIQENNEETTTQLEEASCFETISKDVPETLSARTVGDEIETQLVLQPVVESQTTNELNVRKRATKHHVKWRPNLNKKRREQGLPYQGKVKTDDNSWKYDINKPGKFLAAPCQCILGKRPTVLKCSSISEQCRKEIFTKFWTRLTWPERKLYIQNLTKLESIKRRRGNGEASKMKKNFSIKYFLKVKHEMVRVCKKMFLATVGMKETTVLKWIKEDETLINNNMESAETRGNRISSIRNLKFHEPNTKLKDFLLSLPKVESHYCRSSTSKLYLEPLWSSTNALYNFYKSNYCKENNVEPLCKTAFLKTFHDMNLSIYTPKKDLCDVCVAHDTNNLSDEKYQEHQELKKEARAEKERDKTANDVFVFTMDLQSVLLCPKSTVSAMYYKTKLIVHNFTLYDLKTHDGYCYLWNESEGGLTSNEFSSIVVHFLQTKVIPKITDKSQQIILYSDGCTGQNRNATLANALLHLSMIHKIAIIQKYLQKGHTQMEVDSMHSCIEKKVRHYKVNVPADYVHLCKTARAHPRPYNVEYLTHNFFKQFDKVKFYNSIRPGRTTGDATVTDIKALKYTDQGEIHYKLRHTDVWHRLNQRFKRLPTCQFSDLPSLYTQRKKIKAEKFNHLQCLKESLLEDYHSFYNNIPHE